MKRSFADIMASMQDDFRKKIGGKIPSWTDLEVPDSLSFEQCSSEAAASYKLRFVPEHAAVADLTGGLGVDSSAFARRAAKLYYFERNTPLFEAAVRNFAARRAALSAGEHMAVIEASNICVGPDSPIPDCDLIYIDPARRGSVGRKVFLLEDCTPDVTELLPALWRHTGRVLLKLSPMADISMVMRRLGPWTKEIHVVELGGEVKELLVYMEKGFEGTPLFVATDTVRSFSFTMEQERDAQASFACPQPGQYLFVPSRAMLKAGAYDCIGLPRLGRHSHLYVCDAIPGARPNAEAAQESPERSRENSPEDTSGNASETHSENPHGTPLGRLYAVERVLPFGSASVRTLAGTFPNADVSCHDLPLRSEELSKRLKCRPGGPVHIFASPSPQGNVMVICRKQL